jgi:predicted metal-dependent hydrolase
VTVEGRYEAGLELLRRGEWFGAHEELELAWRAAPADERDFFQGLVHLAVAWYQSGRGRRIGCERQLEKAVRRLGPYAPRHRGLDLEPILAAVEAARRNLGTRLPADSALVDAVATASRSRTGRASG